MCKHWFFFYLVQIPSILLLFLSNSLILTQFLTTKLLLTSNVKKTHTKKHNMRFVIISRLCFIKPWIEPLLKQIVLFFCFWQLRQLFQLQNGWFVKPLSSSLAHITAVVVEDIVKLQKIRAYFHDFIIVGFFSLFYDDKMVIFVVLRRH